MEIPEGSPGEILEKTFEESPEGTPVKSRRELSEKLSKKKKLWNPGTNYWTNPGTFFYSFTG